MDLLDRLTGAIPGEAITVRALVEWFVRDGASRGLSPQTLVFYQRKLRWLVDAAGDRRTDSLTPKDLKLLLQHYQTERKWSPTMTNHVLTAWRVFFRFAVQEELLVMDPTGPLAKVRAPMVLPEPLSADDIRRLLDAQGTTWVDLRHTAMLLVFLDCGLRLTECLSLHIDDLDWQTGQVRVRRGKGGKERYVPYSTVTQRALRKWVLVRGERDTPHLWVAHDGVPLSQWAVISWLRRLSTETGINLHAHRLRHTFAYQWVVGGGSLEVLQRLLGHASQQMTQRYAHLANVDAASAHAKHSPALRILGPRYRGKHSG